MKTRKRKPSPSTAPAKVRPSAPFTNQSASDTAQLMVFFSQPAPLHYHRHNGGMNGGLKQHRANAQNRAVILGAGRSALTLWSRQSHQP